MAHITPTDWQHLDCLNDEEKATLSWLGEALPDDYQLFAGLGWAASHGGGGAYFGEIDVAVLAPSGKVLLIEQKNGGLSIDNGDIIKRYHNQPKSVLSQIRRSVDAIKRQWTDQQHTIPLPVEYLVYLPDYRVHDISAVSVQAERVVDRSRSNELPDIIRNLLDTEANPTLHQQVLDFLHSTAAITQDPDIASLRVDQRYQTEGHAPRTTAQLSLQENYRSAREIVGAINQVLKLEPRDIPSSALSGESPALHEADMDDQTQATIDAINTLLERGFKLDDITVLSYHGYASSALLALDQLGPWRTRRFTSRYDSNGNQQYTDGELRVESLHRFKGLQSPAVVLSEIDFDQMDDEARRRLYVGMTRAKLALALVLTPGAMRALERSLQTP